MGKNTLNSHIKHFWLHPQQAFLLKKKAFNLTGMYGIAYSWNTINSDFFPEKIKNNAQVPGQSNKIFENFFSISITKASKLGVFRHCDKKTSILSLCP